MRNNTRFALTPEAILRITRISVYLAVLVSFVFFFQGDFAGWIRLMPISAWSPVGATHLMYPLVVVLKAPDTAWLGHLFSIGIAAGAIACIFGWKWRIASLTTLLLSLIVFGLKNSFGHAFRSESILILAQLILTLGPAHKTISSLLDAQNTLLLLRLLWVSMFFFGALNKLRFSGWAWARDNYLHDYLMANQITRAGTLAERPFSEYVHVLIEHPSWTLGLGCFVLLFELLYPLILTNRLRVPILASTVLFQFTTFTLLGVNFLFYLTLIPIWLQEVRAVENRNF